MLSSLEFKNKVKALKNEVDKVEDDILELKLKSQALNSISLSSFNTAKNNSKIAKEYSSSLGRNVREVDFLLDKEEVKSIDRLGEPIREKATVTEGSIELESVMTISAIDNNNVKNAKCYLTKTGFSNYSETNSMENIIDKNSESFWLCTVSSKNKLKNYHDKELEIESCGAFAEICIELESVRTANSIIIKPYSVYDFSILYIKYTETDNPYEEKKLLSSESLVSFFQKILVKRIYIGVVQTNYVQKNLKYTYSFGFSYVDIQYKNYNSRGVFETKSIAAKETITRVILEDNTLNSIDNVEYYISLSKKPSKNDWYPILPYNKDIVNNERLIGTDVLFRFLHKAKHVLEIRENGNILDKSKYTLKKDGQYFYGVEIPNSLPTYTYIVSYVPDDNSKVLDFSNLEVIPYSSNEIINCNDYNSYTLADVPYNPIGNSIDVNILDNNKNKMFKQTEGKVQNTTGTEEFVFNNVKFQYYIQGNRIFFNKSLDDRYIVSIKYNSVKSSYRLKVILYRTDLYNRNSTQVVKGIKVITEG